MSRHGFDFSVHLKSYFEMAALYGYGVACALGFGSLVPREYFGAQNTCCLKSVPLKLESPAVLNLNGCLFIVEHLHV